MVRKSKKIIRQYYVVREHLYGLGYRHPIEHQFDTLQEARKHLTKTKREFFDNVPHIYGYDYEIYKITTTKELVDKKTYKKKKR